MAMMSGKQAEINVTPLIDVLLVLLIIFMVIVPQKSTGLEAKIPQPANTATPAAPPREIVVTIAEDRSLKINTQPVAWNDLDERLRQIFAQRPDGLLFLAGAPAIDFEDVATVFDIARGAGISKVALMPRNR
jgi:biopolymer transport protein TolR